MLRNGEYIMAKSLSPGDSLMPLYRKHENIEGGKYEYEKVFMPSTQKWEFTHRISQPRCPKGWVRHHADFNRFNNDPENLVLLKWEDHQRVHQENIARVAALPQTAAARKRNAAKMNADHKGKKRPELCVPRNFSTEQRMAAGRRGARVLTEFNKSESHRQDIKLRWSNSGYKAKTLKNTIQRPDVLEKVRELSSQRMKANNHIRWHLKRESISNKCDHCVQSNNNHKVVSIESCGFEDVYDITVDKYHNFALESGVFVHNCDPCEDSQFGYQINGILVSDFVTPHWFHTGAPGPYDFQNRITKPLQLLPGGYCQYLDIGNSMGWVQQTDSHARKSKTRAPVGSRRERRRVGREAWKVSTPTV
jgi:hypothetical protein